MVNHTEAAAKRNMLLQGNILYWDPFHKKKYDINVFNFPNTAFGPVQGFSLKLVKFAPSGLVNAPPHCCGHP